MSSPISIATWKEESILSDRYHNNPHEWCNCKCHLFFEVKDMSLEGCLMCHLEKYHDATINYVENCTCGYTHRICASHAKRLTTKRAI